MVAFFFQREKRTGVKIKKWRSSRRRMRSIRHTPVSTGEMEWMMREEERGWKKRKENKR